jgi:hypothetical protein
LMWVNGRRTVADTMKWRFAARAATWR